MTTDCSHRRASHASPPAPVIAPVARVGRYRWVICFLLFLAATINYIDRQVIGLLKPTLQQQFGWSEIDYADIVFSFQLAYAIGLLLAGRFIDRVGTRIGFAIAVGVWSVAAMAHAEAAAYGPARGGVARRVRPGLCAVGGGLHRGAVRAWASAKRGTFRPRSRRWRSGSRLKERAFATGPLQLGHQHRRGDGAA